MGGCGASTKKDGAAKIMVWAAPPHGRWPLQRQLHHARLIAMQDSMNGQCNGSKDGLERRKSFAARLSAEVARPTFRRLLAFRPVVSRPQPTPVPMIAMLVTTLASIV